VDRGLVLFSPGPRSYTGEDLIEFQLHGGRAVVEHALAALTKMDGVRLAEPGEFTRRAFENGKLDLTEAEGVADLVESETLAQKAQALRQLGGGLSQIYEEWRSELTELLALTEAMIDFPDEADIEQHNLVPLLAALTGLKKRFETALGDYGIGEKIRDGFRVAIVGPANAGKSSILNRLARRDAAIVTDIAGTTRDIVEVRIRLAGQLVWLADTAGLRVTDDLIEREGIRRTEHAAREADLRIHVIDSLAPCPPVISVRPHDLVILNKCDQAEISLPGHDGIRLSAITGEGLEQLEQAVAAFVAGRASYVEAPVITRARHREKLSLACNALDVAVNILESGDGLELAAEELRIAERALSSIIGRIDVEDVLGAVFSRFCIGK
jgi:tRNA modification GTPase